MKTQAEYSRERRERLIEDGLCADCGKHKPTKDRDRCALCMEKRCKRERAKYGKPVQRIPGMRTCLSKCASLVSDEDPERVDLMMRLATRRVA